MSNKGDFIMAEMVRSPFKALPLIPEPHPPPLPPLLSLPAFGRIINVVVSNKAVLASPSWGSEAKASSS